MKFLIYTLSIAWSFGLLAHPLHFTENRGQIKDSQGQTVQGVHYYIQAEGLNIFLTNQGIRYIFEKQEYSNQNMDSTTQIYRTSYGMALNLIGMSPNFTIETPDPEPFYLNFYNVTAPHYTEVHTYKTITYKNVYPNIDWIFKITDKGLKYDFVVHPGGDPAQIQLEVDGASAIDLLAGELHLQTPMGSITEAAPYSYQQAGTDRYQVGSRWRLQGQFLSFNIGDYDPNRSLIIDPYLTWATFYGHPTTTEWLYGNAIDKYDHMTVIGVTYGTGITPTYDPGNGAYYNSTLQATQDALILKFDENGARLWATYVNSCGAMALRDVTVDSNANIFTVGEGACFAYTNPGGGAYFQNISPSSRTRACIFKFSRTGQILWSTMFAGSEKDFASSVVVDQNQDVYVGGRTQSTDFPVLAQTGSYNDLTHNGNTLRYDMYIAKFNNSGVQLWTTFYGGQGDDQVNDMAITPNNDLVIAAHSNGSSLGTFPYVNAGGPAYFSNVRGGTLMKFNAAGQRIHITSITDVEASDLTDIDVDTSGNIFMIGDLPSYNPAGMPLVNPGGGAYFDNSNATRMQCLYLIKFRQDLSVEWSTTYGLKGNVNYSNRARDIRVDQEQNVIAICRTGGHISSLAFPFLSFVTGYNDNTMGNGNTPYTDGDFGIVRFDNNGVQDWSTYYGGFSVDDPFSVAINSQNEYIIAGITIARGCGSSLNPELRQPVGNVAYYDGIANASTNNQEGIIVRFSPNNLAGVNRACAEDEVNTTFLPVIYSVFEAQLNKNEKVDLFWETASEKNNAYFKIQRSTNGIDFESIGEVHDQETITKLNSYQFTDQNPQNGYNYYRIKQVDIDQNYSYSPIQVVEVQAQPQIQISQNQQEILIQHDLSQARYKLLNINGQKIAAGQLPPQHQLDKSRLPGGTYLLQVLGANFSKTYKIVCW